MAALKKYYDLYTGYCFNEPFAHHYKNKDGEDCTTGHNPWCQCSKHRPGIFNVEAGRWLVCSKCFQPKKEELTECPTCLRLWRGPRPNFPFALECYECE